MPQATNLVIKNGAASPVDKTFTLIAPAAGDGGIAKWVLKEGTIAGAFPVLTASAQESASGAQRTLKVKFKLPSTYVDAVTGRTILAKPAAMNASFDLPSDFPEALKPDFAAYATNALKTALLVEMIKDAYPAT